MCYKKPSMLKNDFHTDFKCKNTTKVNIGYVSEPFSNISKTIERLSAHELMCRSYIIFFMQQFSEKQITK